MQKNNNLELFSGSNCNYFYTNLPQDILDGITKTCEELRPHLTPTKILTKEGIKEDKSFRDNQSVGIPTYYWFAGMIWHYIMRVNAHNFNYDITCFGEDMIEFMSYEKGGHYKWHQDHTLYNTIRTQSRLNNASICNTSSIVRSLSLFSSMMTTKVENYRS